MQLFTDLLPTPTPISQVVEHVASTITKSPSHHPENPVPSRAPNTGRMGVPPTRQNPWQRIGRSFTPTSDAMEALHRSGLNWTVEKVGLRTEDLTPVEGHVAIKRTDTGRILGITGRDFEPLQNADAFAFFSDLAGEARISFETAGSFEHGGITWVQAKLPDLTIRLGEDISDSFLFISNGHVGNKMLTIAPTTHRIACRNTMAMAERQYADARRQRPSLASGFSVRHTKGMNAALADIRDAYARTLRSHAATTEAYEHLARKPLTTVMTDNFITAVFEAGVGPDESDRAKTIRINRRERINSILASPTSNVRGTAGTAFALFQAAIEHIDHDRVTRAAEGEDPIEKRMASAVFGSGSILKARAWNAALEVAV
ncbi:MAG: DUF932 domain-containing protein [Planctomycetota bacterium]